MITKLNASMKAYLARKAFEYCIGSNSQACKEALDRSGTEAMHFALLAVASNLDATAEEIAERWKRELPDTPVDPEVIRIVRDVSAKLQRSSWLMRKFVLFAYRDYLKPIADEAAVARFRSYDGIMDEDLLDHWISFGMEVEWSTAARAVAAAIFMAESPARSVEELEVGIRNRIGSTALHTGVDEDANVVYQTDADVREAVESYLSLENRFGTDWPEKALTLYFMVGRHAAWSDDEPSKLWSETVERSERDRIDLARHMRAKRLPRLAPLNA